MIPVFLVYFFLGFTAIVVQSILIREFLVIAYGNELIIGTIFFVWFLWIAFGAGVGAPLLRRIRNRDFVFWLVFLAGLALFPVQVIAIRMSKLLFAVPIGTFMPFSRAMVAALLTISPFSLMIGLTFPMGAHVFQSRFFDRDQIIGLLYIFEALGSLCGGLVFTLLLVTRFSPFQIHAFLIFLALCILLFFERRSLYSLKINGLIFVMILLGITITLVASSVQNWSVHKRWYSIGGRQSELIADFNTPYEHISISRLSGQFSLYENGHLAFSFPNPYDTRIVANLLLLQHPNPKRMLVLATGIYDLIDPLFNTPDLRVDWVLQDRRLLGQLEPLLPDSTRAHLYSARMKIVFADGRSFLQNIDQFYDIIYLDLPPPATAALNRYYSLEFFQLARKALRPEGVLVLHLPLSDTYLSEEILQFASSVFTTLKTVFPATILTSGERNFLFAPTSAENVSTELDTLVTRWQQRNPSPSLFSPYSLTPYLQSERIAFLRKKITEFAKPVLNTDRRPVSYLFNLILWNYYSGGDRVLQFLWGMFRRVHLLYVVLFFALLVTVRMGWLFFHKKNAEELLIWNSIAGVGIGGCSAMGLEIVLLFGFQNLFGSLYQDIALVTAVFMFGLALGSWGINRNLTRIQNVRVIFIVVEVALLVLALCLPIEFAFFSRNLVVLTRLRIARSLYLIGVALVGGITGTVFPLAGKGLRMAGKRIGGTASAVDAADHVGACLGAFFTGTFLLPLLGLHGVGVIIAFLNLTAILFWLLSRPAGSFGRLLRPGE